MPEIQRFDYNAFHELAGNDKPLTIFSVQGEKTLGELHMHDFTELVIVTFGTGTYQAEQNLFNLKPGDVFLLPRGMKHRYLSQNNLAITNVLFIEDELKMPLYDLTESPGYHALPEARGNGVDQMTFTLTAEQLSKTEELLSELKVELHGNEPGSMLMSAVLFARLLVYICRCFATSSDGGKHDIRLRLDNVLIYIRQHYAENISRGDMARVAMMSESSFARHFNAAMGKTSGQYLMEYRLRRAEEMLRNTELSIAEIALRCGFCDGNRLSVLFRRHYLVPPLRYRKKQICRPRQNQKIGQPETP